MPPNITFNTLRLASQEPLLRAKITTSSLAVTSTGVLSTTDFLSISLQCTLMPPSHTPDAGARPAPIPDFVA